ncbi:uncharacterized protein RHO25_010189 [Cercospora beticola]|uniref:Uncharacterized protein n=1 Tax=Cercospora beticola TaxID=122368 RepID=A0ABZ0P1B7_CERBT|nr:hypothetical protein RHO25_010189 [Cercospora beticola]CAK1365358.1 unnamed protein product [Cercospora beticola]
MGLAGALDKLKDEGLNRPAVNKNYENLIWDWWYKQVALKAMADILSPGVILSNYLTSSRDRRCLDPRDKVFALLGLPDMRAKLNELKLIADYTMTPEDVLIQVLLRYEELDFQEKVDLMAPDSHGSWAFDIELHQEDLDNVAYLLFASLGRGQYYEDFQRFQTHARSQQDVTRVLKLPKVDKEILAARCWVLSHLPAALDHKADVDSKFLEAVYQYWQQVKDEDPFLYPTGHIRERI